MEQITSSEFRKATRHVIAHSKTDPITDSFHYVWTISNFWSLFQHISVLTSDKKLPFVIEMKFNNERTEVCFHLHTNICSLSHFFFLEDVLNKIMYRLNFTYHDNQLCHTINVLYLMEGSPFLWNNSLKIHCQFFLIKTIMHKSICNTIAEPEDMLPININYSISNEYDTSIILIAFGERFEVNKNLLSSKSSVFKSMFDENPVINEFVLLGIGNITKVTLNIFLSFLQTGHIVKDVENFSRTTLYELFILANDYNVQDLKLVCRFYIIKTLDHEAVIETLILAHVHDDENLKKIAIDYIKLYMNDMRNSINFVMLLQNYPELLAYFMTDDLSTEFNTFSSLDIASTY